MCMIKEWIEGVDRVTTCDFCKTGGVEMTSQRGCSCPTAAHAHTHRNTLHARQMFHAAVDANAAHVRSCFIQCMAWMSSSSRRSRV